MSHINPLDGVNEPEEDRDIHVQVERIEATYEPLSRVAKWGYRIQVDGYPGVEYWIDNPRYEREEDGCVLTWGNPRLGDGRDPDDCDNPHEDFYLAELEDAIEEDLQNRYPF